MCLMGGRVPHDELTVPASPRPSSSSPSSLHPTLYSLHLPYFLSHFLSLSLLSSPFPSFLTFFPPFLFSTLLSLLPSTLVLFFFPYSCPSCFYITPALVQKTKKEQIVVFLLLLLFLLLLFFFQRLFVLVLVLFLIISSSHSSLIHLSLLSSLSSSSSSSSSSFWSPYFWLS